MTTKLTEQPIAEHVTRSWSKRISYRWGTQLGDVSEYSVTRRGDSIDLHGIKGSIPLVVAECMARAILDLAKRAPQ